MRGALLIAMTVALSLTASLLRADESTAPVRGDVAALEDRLKTGLRVKAPRDVAFVETVARRVREGRLPERLVDSTYSWAIARGKKHPFPAFEHVMRLQARKLNVAL